MNKNTFKTIVTSILRQHEVDGDINAILQLAQSDTYFMGTTIDEIGQSFDMVFLDAYNNNKEALDLIHWWMYEDIEKFLYDSRSGEVINDLTELDDLYEYLEKYYTKKDTSFDGVGGYGSSGRKPLPKEYHNE